MLKVAEVLEHTNEEQINKTINFTQEELRLIYAACMSYGEKLSNIIKSVPNEKCVIENLSNRSEDSWDLASKITEYIN